MPVYNAERFIFRTIKSPIVLNAVDEIILSDYGSTDNIFSTCKRMEKDSEVLSNDFEIDGVYIAVGFEFLSNEKITRLNPLFNKEHYPFLFGKCIHAIN